MPTNERSMPKIASLVLPSLKTRQVAVRSLSIAWTGPPKRRKPTLSMPKGGLMIRRAAPAYSKLDMIYEAIEASVVMPLSCFVVYRIPPSQELLTRRQVAARYYNEQRGDR